MTPYYPSPASIHILARALIIQGDSFLICKHKDHYFLPGGHVENGESLIVTLKRELLEELGEFKYTTPVHIGICEHQFVFKENKTQHEINHIFVIEVDEDITLESKESFLSFEKIKISDLQNIDLLPPQLKPALTQWFRDKKEFFVGM